MRLIPNSGPLAYGRGFRPVAADAVDLDLPVSVGLNELNTNACLEFSGGMAEQVQPEHRVLLNWLRGNISETSEVA
ncbi:DUF2478 domain-containing protein [uncultured Tateyamaria sp.]|uniref:DUF2478 domain-containing protein n=1 Tax=uncultured Tateyamaria sp. TaxID=455651 RepID=UPI003451F54B